MRRSRNKGGISDTSSSSDSDSGYSRRHKRRKKDLGKLRQLLRLWRKALDAINTRALALSLLYGFAALMLLGAAYYYGATILNFIISAILYILPKSWTKSTSAIVEEALAKYSADRLGVADYALETAGGSVLCNSDTFFMREGALYTIFGIPVWYHSSNPRAVIQPDVQPGQCWAMMGSQGFVTLQLAMPIIPTAVSLEHIPGELATSGLSSAPKDFQIEAKELNLDSANKIIGRYSYKIGSGSPIQMFELKDSQCLLESGDIGLLKCPGNKDVFSIITLKILSNHGNRDYTCIYRLRVHGYPRPTLFQTSP